MEEIPLEGEVVEEHAGFTLSLIHICTSISITNQSAGDQLLSELGKGAIQGVSQDISRKMREEKVHLKSGYTLMLYQNDNQ